MRLLAEGRAEIALAQSLGVGARDCKEHGGRPEVFRQLRRSNEKTALVDEDPNSERLPYFDELREASDEHGMRVLQVVRRQHRIVVIRPRFEDWIIQTAKTAGLRMEDYKLPGLPTHLPRGINSRLDNLNKLVVDLLKAESPRLLHLRRQLQTDSP